jgi:hypothetical protein
VYRFPRLSIKRALQAGSLGGVLVLGMAGPALAEGMATSVPEASPLALWALGTLILASTRFGRRRKNTPTPRRRASDQKTWGVRRRAARVSDAGAAGA